MPAYTLKGYKLRWVVYAHGSLPMEQRKAALPVLRPGEQHRLSLDFKQTQPESVKVEVVRPTGFSVAEAWWKA